MLVRVKMLGSGTVKDPYRAPLPEYNEVLTLHDQGLVYALIPDETHPELDKHASAKVEKTGHGPALIALDAAGHASWHSHIDKRYQERKGEYRPEIA
jgi:hypothetical protein